ncbi:Helitron helicase-like domain [Phytophthora cactorum]|nr:Helitron helicase-like domain [Phytophthora cactorum]
MGLLGFKAAFSYRNKKGHDGDDAASARLLMRQMDAFVKDVLGLDPGLLGEVRAYFGMVETQGRGTLHGHFLIWLCRCPPNAESFEKQVATDSEIFLNEVAQYADSTNQLPIPLDW